MNMKILCVKEGVGSEDIMEALGRLGYQAELYEREQKYSIVNSEEVDLLIDYIRTNHITHLLSLHLIYNLSAAAVMTGIKYLAIIWDAPYDKLFSLYGKPGNCWYSVFDRVDAQRFREAGFAHILYQPLAVNQHAIQRWQAKGELVGGYYNDICFIGSLYDDNAYDKELGEMPETMQNYFGSIFEEAAFCWDGENHVFGKTGKEMLRYLEMITPGFTLNNTYDVADERLFENLYLVRKLANIERIGVLNLLAEYFPVTCSTYQSRDVAKLRGVRVTPPTEEGEAFSIVVARSRINLNISLKGMRGGTPKRVIDIMGAGGFVLSTYCKETADLFEEGREIEFFRTPEELVEKAAYYLEHEKERKAIARAGQKRVLKDFTYEKYLKRFIKWVEGDTC